MASKLPKDSGMLAEPMPDDSRPPKIYLEVPFKEIKDVEVDDKITMTIRGKVVGVNIHQISGDKQKSANIDIEDPSFSVKTGSSKIEDFDEDMD